MSKTIYYKTLRGLLNQSANKTLSVSNVICGRFYHKKIGFVSFRLSDDELRTFIYGVCSILGIRRDRETIFNNIRHHNIKDRSIFERLEVQYKKGYGFSYMYHAGQDYIVETRFVRKLLRGN